MVVGVVGEEGSEGAQANTSASQGITSQFTMKETQPAQGAEHVAASLDQNVARSQPIDGNLITPFFFPSSHESRYLMAMSIMMVWICVMVGCALFLKWLLRTGNKKLKEEAKLQGTPCVPYTT
jgi:hypothetical protein